MKKIVLFISFLLYLKNSFSQAAATDTLQKTVKLDEVVISVNKFALKKKYIAQPIINISATQIKNLNVSTTADLLLNTGNVAVQKSQLGGGSLILRGFEASRVLMVIDGVRMNNAIYRAGHLQDVITLDNAILDRVEILLGPSSTIYGSDALGGVVHFYTKKPTLSSTEKIVFKGNAYVRYGTAADEISTHADINIGGKKWGSFSAFTFSNFNDLRQGAQRNGQIGNLGLRNFYQARINNNDTMLANKNPNKQIGSGYHQYDILQKFLYQPHEKVTHILNVQISQSSNVPRYDRLTETTSSGIFKSAEWYYGPQKRNFVSYEMSLQNRKGLFTEIKGVASYQFIQQSRFNRNWKSENLNRRIENVKVGAFTIDARRQSSHNDFTMGIDMQLNDVKSVASRLNIVSGQVSKLDTRYPDGKNRMNYYAFYFSDVYKITSTFTLNAGLRYSYTYLNANFVDTSIFQLPFTNATQKHDAITGNFGMVFTPRGDWKIAMLFSSGFRSPNLDDLTKIFESVSGQRLIVPNPDLKPEYTYNAEIGISKVFEKKIKAEANLFYTKFSDAIVTDRFTYNGQTQVFYNGALTPVFANQNKREAFLMGFAASLSGDITEHVSFYSQVTYTYGRIKNYDGSKTPLDHIPPTFGSGGVKFHNARLMAEAYCLYNGAKRPKDYNITGEDNQQYSADPVNGYTPAWFTINVRSSYQVQKNTLIQVALENVFDRNYRTFASGISAPGRNFILTLRLSM